MKPLDLLHLQRRIDRLVAAWDRPDTPGCTVGVVREGALVLQRCAGMASLELAQPIHARTTFRVASVTKQFTCAAILLLAAEGKLTLGDDMRRHLPELPDFGATITLDHLMHNASGLRDMLEIARIGGMDLNVPCRREDLLAMIARQRALNFAPGTRFLYSNTNFLLLGLVVERVSGTDLAAFLDRRILSPLGMNQSRLVASTNEIVTDLATGYFPRPEGGFVRAGHGFPLGGEGGLVSSVADLALWDRNFATGRVGGRALGEALAELAPFANGTMNAYARGLEVRDWRGLRTESHGGLWPGYRTEFLRVPERDLTVICIANNAAVDPYRLAHDVLDAALGTDPAVHPVPALPPRETLERVAGRYLDVDSAATLEMALNAEGEPVATMNGVAFALEPTPDGRLRARRGAFAFTAGLQPDEDRIVVERDAGHVAPFRRVAPEAALPDGLAGRYANEDAAATWTIALDTEGRLALHVAGPHVSTGPWTVEPVRGDFIRIVAPGLLFRSWLDARVQRDASGAISGILVGGARAWHFLFRRLPDRAL